MKFPVRTCRDTESQKSAQSVIQTTVKFSSQFRMTPCIMGYCLLRQQYTENIDVRPEHQAYA